MSSSSDEDFLEVEDIEAMEATFDRSLGLDDFVSYYRVSQKVWDLGWVDLDFGCYTICLILFGLMR